MRFLSTIIWVFFSVPRSGYVLFCHDIRCRTVQYMDLVLPRTPWVVQVAREAAIGASLFTHVVSAVARRALVECALGASSVEDG